MNRFLITFLLQATINEMNLNIVKRVLLSFCLIFLCIKLKNLKVMLTYLGYHSVLIILNEF